jgi:hypothetical protein
LLRFVLFDTMMFQPDDDVEQTRTDLMWLLEALAQRDQNYLRQHPDTPRLYKSGVVWEAPQQFNGECRQVAVLRQALGTAANKREVADVLDLVQEVFGGEHFCDVGRILQRGKIDCFPSGTRLLRRDGARVAVEDVRPGDAIWGRHRWSVVKAVQRKDRRLPVWRLHVASRSASVPYVRDWAHFDVTSDHKVFVVADAADGHPRANVTRARVGEIVHSLVPGMSLIAPKTPREVAAAFEPGDEFAFRHFDPALDKKRELMNVTWENSEPVEVWDVQTDDHYVYLPDADVTVSNCDGLAAWRVAELRQAGVAARPYMTNRKRLGGGTTYHALVLWPGYSGVAGGRPTSEDPSLLLGMGGAARAGERAEEIRKNVERCDLLRASGGALAAASAPFDVDAALAEILGGGRGGGGHHHRGGAGGRSRAAPLWSVIERDVLNVVDDDDDDDDDDDLDVARSA